MALDNLIVLFVVLCGTSLAYLALVTYQHRSRINTLRKQGFVSYKTLHHWPFLTLQPMPAGWSWLFGHSLVLLRYTSRFPPLANVAIAMQELSREFTDTEMFLVDMWPSYPTSIIVFNPEAANLVTQKYNLPKPAMAGDSVEPIVGGPSILSMNAAQWKTWRSLLNPGFSATSLLNHIPYIVDCVQIFCDKLESSVGHGIISLDDFATRLTFDVIMKVALDCEINYQRSEHILPTAINTITRWHSFWDPRVLLHPLRPFIQKYYGHVVRRYIRSEIEQRFEELKAERLSSAPSDRAHSVISLALEAFIAKNNEESTLETARLDNDFAAIVCNQIRLFLFAGNDTTSSTIVFAFHLMSKHRKALAQLRDEHDAVFGKNISKAADLLKTQPSLLNQCRYTLAFIKETLRVYPPAANMRLGQRDIALPALDGQMLQTGGLNIILLHQIIHQNPRVWVRTDEFLPERWLVEPGHDLYPPEGAFRPFDIGPRSCIGQTLTLNEIRIVLILAVRTFAIKPAYEEWDKIQTDSEGLWTKIESRFLGKKLNKVRGDRAYQTEKAGTHPSDGYPCLVSFAD